MTVPLQPISTRFRFFPQLNQAEGATWFNSRLSMHLEKAPKYFGSDSLQDKLVRALAAESVLPVKELLECCEMFARIRKKTRRPVVADLCCGHGLLGVLFAIFEPRVERVILVDRTEPPSRKKLLGCAERIAPWSVPKIESWADDISLKDERIPEGASIISAHACGILSDLCIDIAIEKHAPLAILPCCYPRAKCEAPRVLQDRLGFSVAYDVDRTYTLERAGYSVTWSEIPPAITPMNRVICGVPRGH